MMPHQDWEEIIDGRRYSIRSSVLIARGIVGPKSPHWKIDWNMFLYRTQEGAYFKINPAPSRSRPRALEPVSHLEALNLFAALPDRCVDLEEAFPAPP